MGARARCSGPFDELKGSIVVSLRPGDAGGSLNLLTILGPNFAQHVSSLFGTFLEECSLFSAQFGEGLIAHVLSLSLIERCIADLVLPLRND